jgi:hypothetical protein
MINLDYDVPLPSKHRSRGKYPWREMTVGSSFFLPKPQGSVSALARAARKATGFQFETRAVVETGSDGKAVAGTRVWRVE